MISSCTLIASLPLKIGKRPQKDISSEPTIDFEGWTVSFNEGNCSCTICRLHLRFDDPLMLHCKAAAQDWLHSDDPLVQDFGARYLWLLKLGSWQLQFGCVSKWGDPPNNPHQTTKFPYSRKHELFLNTPRLRIDYLAFQISICSRNLGECHPTTCELLDEHWHFARRISNSII